MAGVGRWRGTSACRSGRPGDTIRLASPPRPITRRRMNFPRFALLDGPTPIQRLHRLEQSLGESLGGVRLFVKRDDLMGIGGGGSKLRKLEFLLGDALAQGCDTFIATGGI